jgi:hypothetical protein
MNFKERVKEILFEELLNEMIVKPNSKDKKNWKGKGRKGKLYFVVKGEDGKNLGFIDTAYVNKIRKQKNNPSLSPKAVAHFRLASVHWFKSHK